MRFRAQIPVCHVTATLTCAVVALTCTDVVFSARIDITEVHNAAHDHCCRERHWNRDVRLKRKRLRWRIRLHDERQRQRRIHRRLRNRCDSTNASFPQEKTSHRRTNGADGGSIAETTIDTAVLFHLLRRFAAIRFNSDRRILGNAQRGPRNGYLKPGAIAVSAGSLVFNRNGELAGRSASTIVTENRPSCVNDHSASAIAC